MSYEPWLATYYENDIPVEIDPDAYRSVVDMLEGAMKRFADRPAFHAFGQTLTTLTSIGSRATLRPFCKTSSA
jgi:long-chain acyl-CoA synthetase